MLIPARSFALAGNATFTVRSLKSGSHLTFKVQKDEKTSRHFVKVMTGTDNETDFSYIGTIFDGQRYFHGKASKISPEAPSAKGFAHVWNHLDNPSEGKFDFMHAGTCCRCGRKLTNPESIESGIGPECAGKMGM